MHRHLKNDHKNEYGKGERCICQNRHLKIKLAMQRNIIFRRNGMSLGALLFSGDRWVQRPPPRPSVPSSVLSQSFNSLASIQPVISFQEPTAAPEYDANGEKMELGARALLMTQHTKLTDDLSQALCRDVEKRREHGGP